MVSIQYISFIFAIAVLSLFTSLFLIDAGIAALLPITKDEKYKDKMTLVLDALWALIGTAAVYLVVTVESVFASIAFVTGITFLLPFLVFLIFLAFHHGFLGYAEGFGYIGIKDLEHKFLLAYSIPTIILAYIGITMFTTAVGGIGVNVNTLEPDYVSIFFNPFNILFFIAVVGYTLYYVIIFFNVKEMLPIAGISLTLGNILFLLAFHQYVPYIFTKAISSPFYWIYIALLYVVLYLSYRGFKFINVISVLLTGIGSFMMGMFIYPYLFNGAVNAYSLMTNPATLAAADLVIGIIGIFVLGGVTAIAYKILYKKPQQVSTQRK